jgi:hypothetical protein
MCGDRRAIQALSGGECLDLAPPATEAGPARRPAGAKPWLECETRTPAPDPPPPLSKYSVRRRSVALISGFTSRRMAKNRSAVMFPRPAWRPGRPIAVVARQPDTALTTRSAAGSLRPPSASRPISASILVLVLRELGLRAECAQGTLHHLEQFTAVAQVGHAVVLPGGGCAGPATWVDSLGRRQDGFDGFDERPAAGLVANRPSGCFATCARVSGRS